MPISISRKIIYKPNVCFCTPVFSNTSFYGFVCVLVSEFVVTKCIILLFFGVLNFLSPFLSFSCCFFPTSFFLRILLGLMIPTNVWVFTVSYNLDANVFVSLLYLKKKNHFYLCLLFRRTLNENLRKK